MRSIWLRISILTIIFSSVCVNLVFARYSYYQRVEHKKLFRHLEPKENLSFWIIPDYREVEYDYYVWVKEEDEKEKFETEEDYFFNTDKNKAKITQENAGQFFNQIRTKEQAMELCEMTLWGVYIKSAEEFNQICEIYQELNVPEDLINSLYQGPKSYSQDATKVDGGFEISFTAYTIDFPTDKLGHMGESYISRFTFFVAPEGRITLKDKIKYLKGPNIGWPKYLREIEKTGELTKRIYEISPHYIPTNFHRDLYKNSTFITSSGYRELATIVKETDEGYYLGDDISAGYIFRPKNWFLRVYKNSSDINYDPDSPIHDAVSENWGEKKYGYQTQLMSASEKYVIGKAMKFNLILKNVTGATKQYDHQSVSRNSLLIKDSDGREVYYKVDPFCTAGGPQPIAPQESVVLFEQRNIESEYLIIKPGKYTIQFKEGSYGWGSEDTLPASNIVEFEVQSGTPDENDL